MTSAAYDYFEHDADIGVIGRGPTIEAAFEQAAIATFHVMSEDWEPPESAETIHLSFREADLELALVTWLNDLLTTAQARGLMLAGFHLNRRDNHWQGTATAIPWPPDAEPGVEVKGATLTALSVSEYPGGWEARCVIDV